MALSRSFGFSGATVVLLLLSAACSSGAKVDVSANDEARPAAQPAGGRAVTVEGDAQAVERCQATLGKPDGAVLVAAFSQTISQVDGWLQRDIRQRAATPGAGPPPSVTTERSPAESADSVAVCWVDGIVPFSGPPPADGSPPATFDRSVFLVYQDGTKRGLMSSTRDRLPVVRPSDGASS